MRAVRQLLATLFLVGSAVVGACAPAAETTAGPPGAVAVLQPRAHSHNDYLHPRPLLDALALGFCSVEADIWLVNDELLVAHDRNKVDSARTLDKLYLAPLWERFQSNGGSIYPEKAPFTLLIDIKNTGAETFRTLDRVLGGYAPMLTTFMDDSTTPGAVTVIISGERAVDVILASNPRRVGIDGRLPDLDGPLNRHQMPLVSDNWTLSFSWTGRQAMAPDEAARLDAIVARAHERGIRLRFWSSPQTDEAWGKLYDAGAMATG